MTANTLVTARFQLRPPDTKITGIALVPQRRVMTFRFAAVGDTRRFQCGLARTAKPPDLVRCRSPLSYDKVNPGVYHFTVQAVGRGGADLTPATRTVRAPIEFSACWGAASRDPEHRCGNRALRNIVVPTPDNALLIPVGFCGGAHKVGPVSTCSFGVAPSGARATIALIGDSHAGALLPAMAYVARTEQWQGLAYIHNGCAFSAARMAVGRSYANQCVRWRRAVVAWLAHQPEISSVVITGAAMRSFVGNADAGFHDAWNALPRWIHRIYIIRDVPHEVLGESDCVQSALARHRPAGTRCAQPRGTVLTRDSEAAAAVDSRSARVRLLDFTPFFCDARRCFPVVGGALVLSDVQHLTREFSLTLGPYILRAIKQAR